MSSRAAVAVAQAGEGGAGIFFDSVKQLSFVSKDLILLLLLFHTAGNKSKKKIKAPQIQIRNFTKMSQYLTILNVIIIHEINAKCWAEEHP